MAKQSFAALSHKKVFNDFVFLLGNVHNKWWRGSKQKKNWKNNSHS